MTTDEMKKAHEALKQPITGPLTLANVVARLNEVFGLGGHRIHRTIEATSTAEGRYTATAEVTIELGVFVDGNFAACADALGDGSHTAATEFQAKVGAYEAAVIHAATMLGINQRIAASAPVVRIAPAERLTPRQAGALNGLSRKLGHSPAAFAASVRSEFGVLPEQLTRIDASRLIRKLEGALRSAHAS